MNEVVLYPFPTPYVYVDDPCVQDQLPVDPYPHTVITERVDALNWGQLVDLNRRHMVVPTRQVPYLDP